MENHLLLYHQYQVVITKTPGIMLEKPQKKIAYFHIQFPKLSESFISREIESLGKLGLTIINYSLKRTFPSELNDHNRSFVSQTVYLPHFLNFTMIYSHLYWFFKRPLAYLIVVWRLFSSRYPPGNMWLAIRKPLLFWRSVHLARLISEDKDIVHLHAHFKYVGLIAWIVSRFTGHSYSFTAHFATNALMVGRIAEDAAFVTAVSEREKKIVESAMSLRAFTPVHIVRLGVPEEYFINGGGEKKSEQLVIISVGRFIPKKGFTFLLRALSLLMKRGVDFNAVCIGDGPQMKNIKSQVTELGLAGRVVLTGALDTSEVRKALDRAHIFALFCTYGPDGDVDGIPVAMMEAMARKLPVVTTRISAVPELIEDSVSGFLVSPGSVTEFADALQKLITDSALREKMGTAAYDKIAREYQLSRQASQMRELFDSIFKQGGR